ncbi:zinc finger and SCAN domain-containing protein 2-like [Achroia grisella]|uniref:zinc finger and SCAN domain-containing protein 2-like n=1 Tax=Achroia grisella TaxID=688607 RepID=UPI0027D2F7AA|nr:zinc finger and SCAN domain-containing protein 2-like [Achroia grisella]
MDFVKREDQHVLDEENRAFKYADILQKPFQMEAPDQHTPISMEQLHQVMQTSLNNSLVHNFQLPLSPRQMSTLMLKTNHLSRSLNFNEIPGYLQRNFSDADLVHNLANELPQNLRHEDLIINRNLDIQLARNLSNELELQNGLAQTLAQQLNEQDLRIGDVLPQNMRHEVSHDLNHELDLSHHLNRNIDQDILAHESRRMSMVQCAQDNHLLEQNFSHALEQNLAQRLDQNLAQRLDQNLVQRLDQSLVQRLDQAIAQRMGQRLVATNMNGHESQRLEGDHLLPMPFHIKSEQDDDSYFYDNMSQGMPNVNGLNGQVHSETAQGSQAVHQDSQIYAVYNNQIQNVPANNPIDLYSRPQNYAQNYISNVTRDNPQNLVIHRQFENASPYAEELKKPRPTENGGKDDSTKTEEPKENLKPTDQNKIYYAEYNPNVQYTDSIEKNENDSSAQNKLSTEDLSMDIIKGEYICYKCNVIFSSKRLLRQHSKTCLEDSEQSEKLGKFGCSQCSYRCQSPAILKIHERTHTGEKPFSCNFCDYKSGQKNNVAKHILVHMKEKPFRCQYCNYRCAQKNNLVVHERTHTGYKPFGCPYCDYRTVQKPNLVKHMYLHTDQKPFSCDLCSYRCVQKTNLTKHKQRHLNEKDGDKVDIKSQVKPYRPRQKSVKCPHCPYRCVQKASLEKHIIFKHSEAPLEQDTQDEGLNLMKNTNENEAIQNLSVRKDEQVDNTCYNGFLDVMKKNELVGMGKNELIGVGKNL